MRKFILPLAALALVAGCKGKAPETVATEAVASETAAMPAAMPALPADAKKVALAGSYANAGASLKLNSDMMGGGIRPAWQFGFFWPLALSSTPVR